MNRRHGTFCVILLILIIQNSWAQRPMSQEIRWLAVGSLQSTFAIEGAEFEMHRTGMLSQQCDGLRWQADFLNQDHAVSKSMWIGTTNYADPVSGETYPYKVIIAGPRSTNMTTEIMPVEFKLLGRFNTPLVYVDDDPASDQNLRDVLDADSDPNLISDRMVFHKMVTSIGISITRKMMAWAQENNDNYFIYEYVFKNTGIIDAKNTKIDRTLTGVVFHFQYRYAFGTQYMTWLPAGNITWGRNSMNQVVGTDPTAVDFEFRAEYSWFGLHSQFPVDSWGCPNYMKGGALGSPSFVGDVVLHADKGPHDQSDDPYQPTTTMYVDSDAGIIFQCNQYDPLLMAKRYTFMTAGHPVKTQADEVGDGFADKWGPAIGGTSHGQGFGPYTLEPRDSIRIVIAEAVGGLKRIKSMEVGDNWFQWYKNISNPKLIMPDGSETTDYDNYKKQWCLTAKDSLFQTFRRAIANYNSNFQIPAPPAPPDRFEVISRSDCIRLQWSNNAENSPYFNGYRIYRAIGRPDTLYKKIFECDKANCVNIFDDFTARRVFDYYYYIQSKDDGSLNDIHPGTPLCSSKFFTKTNVPAYLRNPDNVNDTQDNETGVKGFILTQNFPNPFNAETSISFTLPKDCFITLKIFDMTGKQVKILLSEYRAFGSYVMNWDGRDDQGNLMPSGIYFYEIVNSEYHDIKRMVYVR